MIIADIRNREYIYCREAVIFSVSFSFGYMERSPVRKESLSFLGKNP